MRSHFKSLILAGVAALAFSSGLRAQTEQQAGAAKAPAASVPAPVMICLESGTCALLPPSGGSSAALTRRSRLR